MFDLQENTIYDKSPKICIFIPLPLELFSKFCTHMLQKHVTQLQYFYPIDIWRYKCKPYAFRKRTKLFAPLIFPIFSRNSCLEI